MIRDFSAIPLQMRQEPNRWGLWRMETRDGKPTKIPYRLDGQRAASTNPRDWTDFPTVCAHHLRRRDSSGIGFRLGEGWAGVDLDKVRNPRTNEIQEWALDIIEMLDSYSEISPSLTGFKVFCRGSLPTGRRRVGGQPDYMGTRAAGIEAYPDGRFFTVTGLGVSPGPLEDRTQELARFHAQYLPQEPEPVRITPVQPTASDNEIISRALSFRNGAKFWGLWNGDTSAYAGDDSAADLALVSELAFVTGGEPSTIDRLFRSSKLFRPKWDEKHGTDTYGQLTIGKALTGRTEFYKFAFADAGVVGRWAR